MPSSKVSKAGCSSGVYSWRRSLIRKGDSYIIKTLVKPSLIQILPNSGWDCFQVWFPKLLISVGGSLSSGSPGTNKTQTGHKIRQGSNPFNKPGFQGQIPKLLSRMAPSSGIYHDFDYFDLVTSSYFLGTHHHHEFINLRLGQQHELYHAQKAIIPRPNRS